VHVDLEKPIHVVSPRYLSFSLDMSQVVGGKWWDPRAERIEPGSGSVPAPTFDFSRPELDLLVRALSPAYLRIAGSESDKVYYDLLADGGQPANAQPLGTVHHDWPAAPVGYESVLTRTQWDAANAFAQRNGLELVFTLNAGPSSRDQHGQWKEENAAQLLAYSAAHGYPLSVWELGNEMNIFWALYALKRRVSVEQYHQDLVAARKLVKRYTPEGRLAGQGSAFWPILGETLFGYTPRYLKRSSDLLDLVTWHYYPQQSRRGPMAVRRAHPSRLPDPKNLDEASHWAEKMLAWRDRYAPGKPVWLGETGNAQFGGEPGLSDVYLSGLWWLDELGLMARHGQEAVVRQTLCGGDYGMIEEQRAMPRPDSWNSLLWKRLMGDNVYACQAAGENQSRLRVHAHARHGSQDRSLTILAINLNPAGKVQLCLPQFKHRHCRMYRVASPDLFATTVLLNGQVLTFKSSRLPDLVGLHREGSPFAEVSLSPLSYTFLVFDGLPL
jgi:heparanase 1